MRGFNALQRGRRKSIYEMEEMESMVRRAQRCFGTRAGGWAGALEADDEEKGWGLGWLSGQAVGLT